MPAIVLESSIGSQYDDSPVSYEFPLQYLKLFESAASAGPLFAILYEPRGDDNTGRMAYVGLARIAGPPVPTGRKSRAGRPLFHVDYAEPAALFPFPVPREVLGEPVEQWLRELPRGRARNVATFGRALRPLSDDDFRRILELAGVPNLETDGYPLGSDHAVPLVAARERAEILATMLVREGAFRRQVIGAYDRRCSISGFSLGRVSVTKSSGVLDAAHIRPVRSDGSDHVSNGLPLTPTLHRLFDAGLFTVAYRDGRPQVVVSPDLEPTMIETPDRGFALPLRDGLPLLLPKDPSLWPNPQQLKFHERTIFRAGAATVE